MGGGDGAGESIMVKLVVSDLDGTLIDSSEQLTDTAREMARWLKDRNVLFTFATGRVQGMTERYAQDMQVSIPYVATNGAALIAPDGVLFRRKVPLKPLETMLRKADCMGMSIITVKTAMRRSAAKRRIFSGSARPLDDTMTLRP